MTRKDYVKLANAISLVYGSCESDIDSEYYAFHEAQKSGIRMVTSELCEILKRDNERFNRERFLKACGINN